MARPYFAYGSNLKLSRLRERVPSARRVAPAFLPDRRLELDKRGRDGSAKANIVEASGDRVWGALYTLDPAHWTDLDGFERGYERVAVQVVCGGARLDAETYVGVDLDRNALAHGWYVRLMVEGAREHGLPDEWIALLEALPFR